jgi:flagellar motor switch protein FliG
MRMSDRVAAVNLGALTEEERDAVYAHLPAAKVQRIRAEIAFLRRLSMADSVAEEMMRSFEGAFSIGSVSDQPKSFIRRKNT